MISLNAQVQIIQHGGNLDDAVKRYNISKKLWLDLSTGISPWSYPFKNLPKNVWQELPPSNHELLTVAAKYYDVNYDKITATPGSQLAIRLIPQLFEPTNVAIPSSGYQEHAASWQMARHKLITYQNTTQLLELISKKLVEHVIIINPNNPSGEKINISTLEKITKKTNGTCIIDEAFIDYYNTADINSATKILNIHDCHNLIILRSIGKFFGLAGIRLGFALGSHPKLAILRSLLEPWSISHPSQQIGIQALKDKQWQQQQITNIRQQQEAFHEVLTDTLNQYLKQYSLAEAGLFNTVFSDKQSLIEFHHELAKNRIWTRFGNQGETSWLRFGLPKDIAQFENKITKKIDEST